MAPLALLKHNNIKRMVTIKLPMLFFGNSMNKFEDKLKNYLSINTNL